MAACVKMDNNYFWRRNFSSKASPPKADNTSVDGSGTEVIENGVISGEKAPDCDKKPVISTKPVGSGVPPSAPQVE